MKKTILCLSLFAFLFGTSNLIAQDEASQFDKDYSAVDEELKQWDPIRGKWLSASMKAMSNNEPIPDRTFPEDLSPGEMDCSYSSWNGR